MHRASKFKKCDITRATKAVREAGLEIARVEVAQDGAIIVLPRIAAETIQEQQSWDWDHTWQGNSPRLPLQDTFALSHSSIGSEF